VTAPGVSACQSSVQVRRVGDMVQVRSSVIPDSPVRPFDLTEWEDHRSRIALGSDGEDFRDECWGVGVDFDDDEIRAFVAGVRAGRFDTLTAEWQTAETVPDGLSDVDPQSYTETAQTPASVELSPESERTPADYDPQSLAGRAAHAICDLDMTLINDPRAIVGAVAMAVGLSRESCDPAAALRNAAERVIYHSDARLLRALADRIDPPAAVPATQPERTEE
jgi:hypothetical protein